MPLPRLGLLSVVGGPFRTCASRRTDVDGCCVLGVRGSALQVYADSTRLDLDHYLEALLRKPGALPGSTVLEQARAAGKFTP